MSYRVIPTKIDYVVLGSYGFAQNQVYLYQSNAMPYHISPLDPFKNFFQIFGDTYIVNM